MSPELCFQCHDKGMFTKKTVHPPVAAGMCTSCHNPHSTAAPKLLIAENICLTCHDQKAFTDGKDVHPPVAAGMCPSCHNPHSTDTQHLLKADPVCMNCHDKAMFEGKSVHPPVAAGMCTSCHQPHKSDNAKLLIKPADNGELCLTLPRQVQVHRRQAPASARGRRHVHDLPFPAREQTGPPPASGRHML